MENKEIYSCRICGKIPDVSEFDFNKSDIELFDKSLDFDIQSPLKSGVIYRLSCIHDNIPLDCITHCISLGHPVRALAIEYWNKTNDISLQLNPCGICGNRVEVWISGVLNNERYNVHCDHPQMLPSCLESSLCVEDCLRWEDAVKNWNTLNPVRMRKSSSIFTDEECADFYRKYTRLRARIGSILREPSSFPDAKDFPHIWKRLYDFAAMSYDELMDEIEADSVILRDCWHPFRLSSD